MAAQPNHDLPRAVLLDAMGTLLEFAPPAPLLRGELERRLGVDIGADAADAAIRAEIRFYRAHLHEGRDAAAVAELRRRCAEAMRPALPPAVADAPGDVLTAALLAALRFAAYPDAAPTLRELRAAGCRLVVVSNWDASLHERLGETGLAGLLDGALASAEVGVAKPGPAIFARALALAGVGARDAWHVGDSPEADVAGARAAGIAPVLLVRGERAPPIADGVPVIASLGELPRLAQYPPGGRR
jgi:putative hydrolase of the HAD superfamily